MVLQTHDQTKVIYINFVSKSGRKTHYKPIKNKMDNKIYYGNIISAIKIY